MFSDKSNVNLLTAQLIAQQVHHIVVCPGSRNAPIVHNLYAASKYFQLYPITDERSASFVAIGLWTKLKVPIAICVTSGSALLNALPGIAEAAFRHIPLILISADRPAEMIGRLDGQTLPQVNALLPYATSWQLPESNNAETAEHCQALLNEAFSTMIINGGQPIHLNVPITEPLFNFTLPQLPQIGIQQREYIQKQKENNGSIGLSVNVQVTIDLWTEILMASKCPLLIIGQYEGTLLPAIEHFRRHHQMLVYAENISNQQDARLALWLDEKKRTPDAIIHMGGCLVNKFYKQHLRSQHNIPVLRIDETNDGVDTFFQEVTQLTNSGEQILEHFAQVLPAKPAVEEIYNSITTPQHDFPFDIDALFLGNSTTVRWANRLWPVVHVPVFCNRGTNGIEGSLSTAAGHSLVSRGKVLCIIGDLSFFYDVNGLWNQYLDGRLRVLLINNSCGAIFHHLPGLNQTPALHDFVAAAHQNTAKGIAQSYNCTYMSAATSQLDEEANSMIDRLLKVESSNPVILEVFTPI